MADLLGRSTKNMTTNSISKLYAIGEASPKLVISWAEHMISSDVYTDSLAVVAGYSEDLADKDPDEFYSDFHSALSELGHDALIFPPSDQRAKQVCEAYLDGDILADRALILLYELWREMTYNIKTESGDLVYPFMELSDNLLYLEDNHFPITEKFSDMTESNWKSYFDKEVQSFLNDLHTKMQNPYASFSSER